MKLNELTRRRLVLGAAAVPLVGVVVGAEELAIDVETMLPGEFSWYPERAPTGPVAVIASIPEQRVHVYRNGIRIAVSTCSTGKSGHETPTGVFTVLQKDKHHHSSTYNNASMPNMNRLTWDGIALHAGNLPGYPASHGCVRLPLEFSERLFDITHTGTPVIVAGAAGDPWNLVHPGLLLGIEDGALEADAVAALEAGERPADWADADVQPVASILITGGDRKVTVVENGEVLAEGRLSIAGDPTLGEHVFTLVGTFDTDHLAWTGITYHPDPANPLAAEETILERITVPREIADVLAPRMHVGMTMVISDLPSTPDSRSGEDFVIMEGALLQTPLPHERPESVSKG